MPKILASQQACQLFIDEEIDKGLAEGKSTHRIGEEVSEWVARIFRVKISSETLRKKASRAHQEREGGTNVPPQETPRNDGGKIQCGKNDTGKFLPGHVRTGGEVAAKSPIRKLRDELKERFPRFGPVSELVNASISEFTSGGEDKEAVQFFFDELEEKMASAEATFKGWRVQWNTAVDDQKKKIKK
jgi:hypothetical protein